MRLQQKKSNEATGATAARIGLADSKDDSLQPMTALKACEVTKAMKKILQ